MAMERVAGLHPERGFLWCTDVFFNVALTLAHCAREKAPEYLNCVLIDPAGFLLDSLSAMKLSYCR